MPLSCVATGNCLRASPGAEWLNVVAFMARPTAHFNQWTVARPLVTARLEDTATCERLKTSAWSSRPGLQAVRTYKKGRAMGELKQRGQIWSIRSYKNGKRYKRAPAARRKAMPKAYCGCARGTSSAVWPSRRRSVASVSRRRSEDVINDYRTNRKRSLDDVERRIEKHLTPFFGTTVVSITTADIREFIDSRQKETTVARKAFTFTARDGTPRHVPEQRRTVAGVSNAEINRELTALKRMFNLAIQAGSSSRSPTFRC